MRTLDLVERVTVRRCGTCGTAWRQRTARWCGACGAQLTAAGELSTDRTRRAWVAAGLAGAVVLATALSVLGLNDTVDIGGGGPDSSTDVDLDGLAATRDTPVTPPTDVCVISDGSQRACGPTVRADAVGPHEVLAREDLIVVRRDGALVGLGHPGLELRWRTPIQSEDDRLHLRDAGDVLLVTTTADVSAVEPHDGTVRWRRSLGPDAAGTTDIRAGRALPIPSARVYAWAFGDTVLALDASGTLTALALDDGTPQWSVDGAGHRPIATPDELVVFRDDGASAWQPDDPRPVWEIEDTLLDVRRPVGQETVPGPIPLTRNRGLLDLQTGQVTRDDQLGATRFLVLPEITIELRWRGGTKLAEVAALEPDGTDRWRRTGQSISCCETTAAHTGAGEVAITSPGRHPIIYDLADGTARQLLARGGAELVGVAPATALWRRDAGLVATDRVSSRERFQTPGELRSVDPLLLAVDGQLVVPDTAARARDSHVRRPSVHSPGVREQPA